MPEKIEPVPPEKQIIMTVNADEAVAYAVKQCLVDVVAAYPITPQTIIVEKFSEFVANGEVHTEFIPVESEHSALSAMVGAAAAGARAFTATASQGLALMAEILYIASGLRLPIVMAITNRALSAPINIHCDHADAMLVRDSGWIQLFVENAQEAYDTTIQAFKIAEHPDVLLPVIVNLDAFVLSHTLEDVRMLPDEVVHKFVGGYRKVPKTYVDYLGKEVEVKLDPANPITMGPVDLYDYYFEHKIHQFEAMRRAKEVIKKVHDEYAEISGRRYGDGLIDPFGLEDAEVAIVVMGSTAGTVRYVARRLRERGYKVGMLKIRAFRPFPFEEVREALKGVKVVGVLDRSYSFGSYSPLFHEVNAAFLPVREKPILVDCIHGLGGRDTRPHLIEKLYMKLLEIAKKGEPVTNMYFVGVRERGDEETIVEMPP